jgi:hypothetical protein
MKLLVLFLLLFGCKRDCIAFENAVERVTPERPTLREIQQRGPRLSELIEHEENLLSETIVAMYFRKNHHGMTNHLQPYIVNRLRVIKEDRFHDRRNALRELVEVSMRHHERQEISESNDSSTSQEVNALIEDIIRDSIEDSFVQKINELHYAKREKNEAQNTASRKSRHFYMALGANLLVGLAAAGVTALAFIYGKK